MLLAIKKSIIDKAKNTTLQGVVFTIIYTVITVSIINHNVLFTEHYLFFASLYVLIPIVLLLAIHRSNKKSFEFIEAMLWTLLVLEIIYFVSYIFSDQTLKLDIALSLSGDSVDDEGIFQKHITNFGGVIGFTVAILLLVISYVRAKQTDRQIDISNKQVAMAQQQKRQDLYVNSFSLLSSENANGHSRIAGIYGLMNVVKETYDDYATNHSKSHSLIGTYFNDDNEVNQAGHADKAFMDCYNYIKHIHDIIFQYILQQSKKRTNNKPFRVSTDKEFQIQQANDKKIDDEMILELQGIFNAFDEKFGYICEKFKIIKRLHNANLGGLYLSGLNLSYANLPYADLHSSDLHGVNLQSSCLQRVDLRNVDLRGVNLQNSDLRYANLHETKIHNANNLQNTMITITTKDNQPIFDSTDDIKEAISKEAKLYHIFNEDDEVILSDKNEFIYKKSKLLVEMTAYFIAELALESHDAITKRYFAPKTENITEQVEIFGFGKIWLICKCSVTLNEFGAFVYKYDKAREVSFSFEGQPPRDDGDTYNSVNDYTSYGFKLIDIGNSKDKLYFIMQRT